LIDQSLRNNPNVQAAQAALRAAQEDVSAQKGSFWPSVSGDLNSSRQETASQLSPTLNSGVNPFSLHTAQVMVSYSLDVFGGNRRQVESLAAQADSQRFQLEATRISLAANIVSGVVQAASLRDQIAATQEIIRLQTEQLAIMRKQLELGEIGGGAVIAGEAALAQVQAQLPALQKQLAAQNDALVALVGRPPGAGTMPQFTLTGLQLPEELPLSLPSKLIEQRPDVRSAEAQMHSASAQIGVAIANRLPQITLNGAIGSTSSQFSGLFTGGTGFWSVAGDVSQPIFQGGTLLHRQRSAEATFDQAGAQYRSVVIAAFQNVADVLQALRYDAEGWDAASKTEQKTKESLDIVRAQLDLGDVSYLAVVVADQAYRQALLGRIQAQANRYADAAALFLALGGGWWNEPHIAQAPRTSP
jgi:NodT family efflux transporter outer membrane factor (OMF) lipoprotein